ncbi:hypothetical protein NA78x_005169 [Anatilimnocola sp. NA78]|uniref:hypothetical protein n=1 Tax=Anatilimnocola sp. NA78 TaxID=3415683 RepID=UPI003CE5C47C
MKLPLLIAGLLFAVFHGTAVVRAAETDAKAAAVETKIGIEGVYFLRDERAGIAPAAANDKSPLILRIASVVRDKDAYLYEIHFIGTRAGAHDLREYLVRSDGEPLGEGVPLRVVVHSVLPKSHDGDLEGIATPQNLWAWPYRTTLQVALIAWGVITGVILLRRCLQPRPAPSTSPFVAPTLADQLQPLVNAALAGKITVNEQAQLEMLLLAHWREKLQLQSVDADVAVRRMWQDETAGKLLREVETWLHTRPGTRQVDVATLLAPYRNTAAITLPRQPAEVAAR